MYLNIKEKQSTPQLLHSNRYSCHFQSGFLQLMSDKNHEPQIRIRSSLKSSSIQSRRRERASHKQRVIVCWCGRKCSYGYLYSYRAWFV